MYYSKEPNSKHLKAQTEIIILLGVVVLSTVIAILVSQQLLAKPEPANVANLKALLKADVEKVIQVSATEVIFLIGKQGGYFNVHGTSVEVVGEKVPYWSICENKFIPTLEQISNNIKTGLESKLNALDFDGLKNKYGKNIEIEKVTKDDINVLIRDEDVILDVYLPTKLEGFDVQQPYKISVQLGFGETYKFASDFIEDSVQKRHFEKFIASLFYHANEDKLPTIRLLDKCGESVFRTFDELKDTAQRIVDHSLSNIHLWTGSPSKEKREFLEYYLPSVNNNTYEDLDIKFYRGADLNENNFHPSENPIAAINSKTLYTFVPKCVQSVNIKYSLNLPIITSVKSGDFNFNFASWVFVDENRIGKCEVREDFGLEENLCDDKQCAVKVSVYDSTGKPIQDAKVSLSSCLLGTTNGKGIADGKAPCGISELIVYNPQYSYFYDVVSTLDLDKNITLKKTPLLLFHFNDVLVNDDSSIDVQPDSLNDIFVIFKPKNRSPWNHNEIFIANINEEKRQYRNLNTYKEYLYQDTDSVPNKYSIEGNLTISYKDGNKQSNIIKFSIPIEKVNNSAEHLLEFTVANNYNQNIVEAELHMPFVLVIPNSDRSTVEGTKFSTVNAQLEKYIKLIWSSTTQEGFLKPGESGKFSVLINTTNKGVQSITNEQAKNFTETLSNQALQTYNDATKPESVEELLQIQENATNIIQQNEGSPATLKLIDFLPANDYEVEVRRMKKVIHSTTYCSDISWDGDCERYTTTRFNYTVFGISNFDFEVKEDDKELYVNAFIPAFNSTTQAGINTTIYYNDMLPAFKEKCNVNPIDRVKLNATICKFGGGAIG